MPSTRSEERESGMPVSGDLRVDGVAPVEPLVRRDARPGAGGPLWLLVALVAGLLLAAAVVVVTGQDRELPTTAGVPGAPLEDPRLTWSPPELTDPTTIVVTNENNQPYLQPGKDYRLLLPEPLTAPGGLIVKGGRNVVVIGGEIEVPDREDAKRSVQRRGLYLTEQTGTVHVEGLHIRGEDLTEGINIDQRDGAVVQLQNIRVEAVQGSKDGHHADVIQTWAGPSALRIDKFTGFSTYQGFFLLPGQLHEPESQPEVDLRRVDLHGDEDSEYLLWQSKDDQFDLELDEVYVDSKAWDETGRYVRPLEDWDGVQAGAPDGGEFVPAAVVGTDYESPGYLE